MTPNRNYVRLNIIGVGHLQTTLKSLSQAIHEVESALNEMRAEHDALASHIFRARRRYRNVSDLKSGKRREVAARLSWQEACDLGFRGGLGEWERLMGAVPKR